jgi:hypothetical protein
LEENDLEYFIKDKVPELDKDEANEKHKNNLLKVKRIIVDFIKDHLIPHVSSLTIPNKMFNALS